MNLEQLTEFFKWMTIINIGLLIISSVVVMVLKNVICKMHGKLFGLKEEQVAIAAYSFLGMYKLLVLVLNIVPYISLVLIT
jgi:hypothetical protein